MLPPGHLAGAYLVTIFAFQLIQPAVTPQQQWILLLIGMFIGIAPDFDFFYGFIKNKTMTASEDRFDHRTYLSHVPLLWLIVGLLVAMIAMDSFWKFIGLLIWIGSWTHFVLDSIEHGVMWLWPFSKKQYALFPLPKKYITPERRFFPFWIGMVKWYAKTMVTFYCEVVLVLIAIGYWLVHRV